MHRILIAAGAEIDGRQLALEPVYYPSLLGAYARAVRGRATLVVAVPAEHQARVRERLEQEEAMEGVSLVERLPAPGAGDIELDLRKVYVPSALRAALSNSGVLGTPAWVVRDAGDLTRAAATLERHDMYILARYLVIPVAKRLAHWLVPTRVSPNAVTAASCLLGVGAAIAPFALSTWYGRVLAAVLVHLSVTLDFTDGYLARLRGTDSRIGYWLDTIMDEVVKFSLFIALAGLALLDGALWGVGAALVVLLLYHVLTCNHWLSKSLEHGDVTGSISSHPPRWRQGLLGLIQRAYERLNYLDVHLYVVALGLLTGTESVVLALFAAVYLFRFVRMLQVRLTGNSNAP